MEELLHEVLGLSNDRVLELQKITGELTKHSVTIAQVLIAISRCQDFSNVEKAFCVHQWTNGYLEYQMKKKLGPLGRIMKVK